MGHILPRLKQRNNTSLDESYRRFQPMCMQKFTFHNQVPTSPLSFESLSETAERRGINEVAPNNTNQMCVPKYSDVYTTSVKPTFDYVSSNGLTTPNVVSCSSSHCTETVEFRNQVPADYLQALNLNRVSDKYRTTVSTDSGSNYLCAPILSHSYSIQSENNFELTDKKYTNFGMVFPEQHIYDPNSTLLSQNKNSVVSRDECAKQQNKFYVNKYLEKYSKLNHIPKVCKVCQKVYLDPKNLKMHMLSHKIIKCNMCNKTFNVKSSLQRHEREHRDTNSKRLINESKPQEEEKVKCKMCFKTFSTRSKLNAHLLKHSSRKTIRCDICGKTYLHVSSLNRHKLLHRNTRNLLPPKQAVNNCSTRNSLKAISCLVCHKQFLNKSTLKTHSLIHCTVKKNFKAQSAAIVTRNKELFQHSSFNSDTDKHKLNKKFVCKICGNKYAVFSSLLRHQKVHEMGSKDKHNPKVLQQYVKPKMKTSLEVKVRQKKCKVCFKSMNVFANSNQIKQVCLNCTKKIIPTATSPQKNATKTLVSYTKVNEKLDFKSMAVLRQRTSEEKPTLDCKVCGKSFKESRTYFSHLKSHHKPAKHLFECPVCNRKYQQKNVMKKHVKSQHKSFPQDKL